MIEFGDQVSAEVNKSNHDPAAAAAHDAQAPDQPVRPTIEKNVMSKGREVLPPERPEGRQGLCDLKDTSAEMLKIDDATVAPDDQDPDPPARPLVEKNVMSKGREVLPPERPEGRQRLSDLKDTSAEMLKIDDATVEPDDQDPDAPERPVVTPMTPPVDSSYSSSPLALSPPDSFSSSSISGSSAPATLLSATVDNVDCNSTTCVQSAGNLLKADIIGGHRRYFGSAAVDGHGGRGRRVRGESARGRRRASESSTSVASERARARRRRASG